MRSVRNKQSHQRLLPILCVFVTSAVMGACGSTSEGVDPADLSPVAAQGLENVKSIGCTGCHTTSGGDGQGPTWKNQWGASLKTSTGERIYDRQYVESSLSKPRDEVRDGYANIMPAFTSLKADEVDAIVKLICELSDEQTQQTCANA